MRTLGMTRDCRGCRFWSEMIACSSGGAIEALCLSPDSPAAGQYTTERATCASWKSGHLGTVDDPPDYGESVRRAYAEEESMSS